MSTPGCSFCKAPLRHTFADLGMVPPVNHYLRSEDLHGMEPFFPLHVFVCEECQLVQLPPTHTPQELFEDYSYFSSYSDSWLAHCKRYVAAMIDRFGYDATSRVVEIASNDGYLLQYFKERGVPVLGIEPAKNVAEVARRNGVPTESEFFGVRTAEVLAARGEHADLLLGNNVLAHVPDINDFVGGMQVLLAPRGVITMEFPHLLRMMRQNQFDTIYHEHFSYLSFGTVQRIFAAHHLTLFDVEEHPTHGGSLRIFARHDEDGTKPVGERVGLMQAAEREAGLDRIETYAAFDRQAQRTKHRLLESLIRIKRDGHTIVGYGAPAKGCVLLNYGGIRADILDYTVDRSPHKQGRFLPGVHLPIHTPDRIAQTRPDYVLILPWNLKDEIMEQMAHVREWGGRFIVPIPEVEVV